MKKYYFFVISAIFMVFFAFPVAAQLTQNSSDVNVNLIPENPGPNEVVHVNLTSYSFSIDSSNITWKINGVVKQKGIGEKSFVFSTGGVGVSTKLEVSVLTKEGETVNQTVNIKPASVDLIWQTESYVPPFYKGKAMFSHQNKVTFIAMPHMTSSGGVEIGPKNLVYKWMQNDSVIQNASGYGKNAYTFTGSVISRPIKISVEVTAPNTGDVANASMTTNPAEPFIVFYEKNPLYGIQFQKALYGSTQLNESEIAVVGMPFFFGTLDPKTTDLSYKWLINGVPIGNESYANTQVFRQVSGVSGFSKISLSIENSNKILQYASSNFDLSFGSEATTNTSF